MKKRIVILLAVLLTVFSGCAGNEPADIAATTLPVYEFTLRLCQGTPLTVTRLVTEEVSCLHDYSLNVRQVKAAESANWIVISGAGLEDFMEDLLSPEKTIDASQGIPLMDGGHPHTHEEEPHQEGHSHSLDPHIWLDPGIARVMAANICRELCRRYPQYEDIFLENLELLDQDLAALEEYGRQQLGSLSCRQIITFHDGFGYLAHAFDLEILRAVEEEAGSEASARELIQLAREVTFHGLPAVFTEKSGSVSAAGILSRETGCGIFQLDMAMSGDSYFDAMYHNIDTLKEALA